MTIFSNFFEWKFRVLYCTSNRWVINEDIFTYPNCNNITLNCKQETFIKARSSRAERRGNIGEKSFKEANKKVWFAAGWGRKNIVIPLMQIQYSAMLQFRMRHILPANCLLRVFSVNNDSRSTKFTAREFTSMAFGAFRLVLEHSAPAFNYISACSALCAFV